MKELEKSLALLFVGLALVVIWDWDSLKLIYILFTAYQGISTVVEITS